MWTSKSFQRASISALILTTVSRMVIVLAVAATIFSSILEVRGQSSAGGFNVKINFQPTGATVPRGYLADSGAIYGDRDNGYSYGWNADNQANAKERNAPNSPDHRYDTFNQMQRNGTFKWRIAVPNGSYTVRVMAGDPIKSNSVYKINVEGALTVNGTPTPTLRWVTGTKTVTVKDGKLTITNAAGAANNKICFVEISSATTNTAWTTVAPSPITRFEAPAAVVNGRLYVFGGFFNDHLQASSRVDVYDPFTNTWTRLADMPIAVTHINPAVVDGTIWFAGGFQGDHPGPAINDVWKYTVASDSWSAGPPLPELRGSGVLVLLDRNLHYFGGYKPDRNTVSSDHWVLSLDGGTNWTTAAPLPDARGHLSGVELRGKIYAIGGMHNHDINPIDLLRVDVYDPLTDSWMAAANLPVPRSHCEPGTFVSNDRIVIVGGRSNVTNQKTLADVTEYDPDTDTWTELPALPVGLRAPSAQTIGDLLIVAGGSLNGSKLPQTTTRTRAVATNSAASPSP